MQVPLTMVGHDTAISTYQAMSNPQPFNLQIVQPNRLNHHVLSGLVHGAPEST